MILSKSRGLSSHQNKRQKGLYLPLSTPPPDGSCNLPDNAYEERPQVDCPGNRTQGPRWWLGLFGGDCRRLTNWTNVPVGVPVKAEGVHNFSIYMALFIDLGRKFNCGWAYVSLGKGLEPWEEVGARRASPHLASSLTYDVDSPPDFQILHLPKRLLWRHTGRTKQLSIHSELRPSRS
jgi:hypothetical protein